MLIADCGARVFLYPNLFAERKARGEIPDGARRSGRAGGRAGGQAGGRAPAAMCAVSLRVFCVRESVCLPKRGAEMRI